MQTQSFIPSRGTSFPAALSCACPSSHTLPALPHPLSPITQLLCQLKGRTLVPSQLQPSARQTRAPFYRGASRQSPRDSQLCHEGLSRGLALAERGQKRWQKQIKMGTNPERVLTQPEPFPIPNSPPPSHLPHPITNMSPGSF